MRKRIYGGLVLVWVFASWLSGQTGGTEDVPVTAVAGESWLNHLHRTFDETSMGKTGRLGPPELAPHAQNSDSGFELFSRAGNKTVLVHGADLYRINCRGCHGELGLGAPPEINSVINPVRASSASAVMERMKNAGIEMSRRDAVQLAQQSEVALLDRLHHGGHDMPSFEHLNNREVRALLAYLRMLAGVAGAERQQMALKVSPERIGEHIVKSTCHICHDAMGDNPSPQQISDGAIPSLATLTLRTTAPEFIRKVTEGAPIQMGTPPLLCRGRMPVFSYVTQEEAADTWVYLTTYPPRWWNSHEPAASPSPPTSSDQIEAGAESNGTGISSSITAGTHLRAEPPTMDTDMEGLATLSIASLCAVMLLGTGLAFTLLEIRRLSTEPNVEDSRNPESHCATQSTIYPQEPQHRVA